MHKLLLALALVLSAASYVAAPLSHLSAGSQRFDAAVADLGNDEEDDDEDDEEDRA